MLHQRLIDVQAALLLVGAAQLDAAFQFAACDFAHDFFAHIAFQAAQIVGQLELHVQEPVVHRADFNVDIFAGVFRAGVGKAGHAVYGHIFSFFNDVEKTFV